MKDTCTLVDLGLTSVAGVLTPHALKDATKDVTKVKLNLVLLVQVVMTVGHLAKRTILCKPCKGCQ